MEATLQQAHDLFVSNVDTIVKNFGRIGSEREVCATYLTGVGQKADTEAMRRCFELLKESSFVLSDERGNFRIPLVTKMSLQDDPEAYLQSVKYVCGELVKVCTGLSETRLSAAMVIVDHVGTDEIRAATEKTREVFVRLKKRFWRLRRKTEYLPFAALIAVSGRDTEEALDEVQECFTILQPRIRKMLPSRLLALTVAGAPGPVPEKCERALAIYDGLSRGRHKLVKGPELAIIGSLVASGLPVETIVDEYVQVFDYFRKQRRAEGILLDGLLVSCVVIATHAFGSAQNDEMVNAALSYALTSFLILRATELVEEVPWRHSGNL